MSGIDDNDAKIWNEAIKDIKKLSKKSIRVLQYVEDKPIVINSTNNAIQPTRIQHQILNDKTNISRKVNKNIDGGKISPQAIIDLHGMTEDQAYNAFSNFVHKSYNQQLRFVLAITGKGTIERPSILNAKIKLWVNLPQINPYILRFSQASVKHGGKGAFYIILRK